jgi:anti-sigma factor RsiW
MELTPHSSRTIRRYLLGELPEAERAALEEQYFSDRELFEQVARAESELVDGYTRGRLDPAERARFEGYYLAHPDRRERARFSKSLLGKLDRLETDRIATEAAAAGPSTGASWLGRLLAPLGRPEFARGFATRLSIAVAAAAVLLAGSWLWFETYRLRQQLDEARGARASQTQRERDLERQIADERKRAEQLAAELERERAQAGPPQSSPSPETPHSGGVRFPETIALVLTSSGLRGGSEKTPTLVIGPETKRVRLQFDVETNEYARYRLGVRPVGGAEIWSQQNVAPRPVRAGASFVGLVPADKLAAGDYVLTLSGVSAGGVLTDVSKAFFHATRSRGK